MFTGSCGCGSGGPLASCEPHGEAPCIRAAVDRFLLTAPRTVVSRRGLLFGGPSVRRRVFMALFGGVVAAPSVGYAEPPAGRVPVVGVIASERLKAALLEGLRNAGYDVGTDLTIDFNMAIPMDASVLVEWKFRRRRRNEGRGRANAAPRGLHRPHPHRAVRFLCGFAPFRLGRARACWAR
jgi:hypothetical protein